MLFWHRASRRVAFRSGDLERKDLLIPPDSAEQVQCGANSSVIHNSGDRTPEIVEDLIGRPSAQTTAYDFVPPRCARNGYSATNVVTAADACAEESSELIVSDVTRRRGIVSQQDAGRDDNFGSLPLLLTTNVESTMSPPQDHICMHRATDDVPRYSGHIHSRDAPRYSGHTEAGVVIAEQFAMPDFVDMPVTAMTEHVSRLESDEALEPALADSPAVQHPGRSREFTLTSAARRQHSSRSAFSSTGGGEAGARHPHEPVVTGCDDVGDAKLHEIPESLADIPAGDFARTYYGTEANADNAVRPDTVFTADTSDAGVAMYLGRRGTPALAPDGTSPPESCVAPLSRSSFPFPSACFGETEFQVTDTPRVALAEFRAIHTPSVALAEPDTEPSAQPLLTFIPRGDDSLGPRDIACTDTAHTSCTSRTPSASTVTTSSSSTATSGSSTTCAGRHCNLTDACAVSSHRSTFDPRGQNLTYLVWPFDHTKYQWESRSRTAARILDAGRTDAVANTSILRVPTCTEIQFQA